MKARGPWRRVGYDLHRTTGFYASAGLVVVAGTGATMAFHGVVEPAVNLLTWSSPRPDPPSKATPRATPPITPDEAVAAALRHAPGTEIRRRYLPVDGKPYRVFLDPPGEHEVRANETRLTIDPHTAAILHEDGPRTTTRADRLLRWTLPLHYGTFGGTPTKAIYVPLALAPLLLAATGLAVRLGRRGKRRAVAKAGTRQADTIAY